MTGRSRATVPNGVAATSRRGDAASARADVVLDALGDPTRRSLLRAVGAVESATATELAATREVSRQAIVKHLQVLAAAGLVRAEKVGREQRYRLEPAPLEDAAAWLASVGATWDQRLERLRARHP